MALSMGLAAGPPGATVGNSVTLNKLHNCPEAQSPPLYKWGNNRTPFPGLLRAVAEITHSDGVTREPPSLGC